MSRSWWHSCLSTIANKPRILYQKLWCTTYITTTKAISSITCTYASMTTLWINLLELNWTKDPKRNTTTCSMNTPTTYSTAIPPPTVTTHKLTHYFWIFLVNNYKVYKYIRFEISNILYKIKDGYKKYKIKL